MKKTITQIVAALLLGGVAGCSTAKINLPPDQEFVVIDVRTAAEFQSGHLSIAHSVPHPEITRQISRLAPERKTAIYLYCRSGRRAEVARQKLLKMGYQQVVNLGSLQEAGKKLNLPVVQAR